MHRKKIHIVQTLFLALVIAAFAGSAVCLLKGSPQTIARLSSFNLDMFRNAFAVINLIIVMTLIWRPTRMIGSLIATAYLGGAIALMLEHGLNPIWPTVILLIVWLVHKMNWWKMWHHGYSCGCKVCSGERKESHDGKDWCECKPGCVCEKGACTCNDIT